MKEPAFSSRPSRRHALTGLGVAAGAVLATALPAAPAAALVQTGTLPVLQPTDDWATVLAATPQVQLQSGATYTLTKPVELPSGCSIQGNGATVTVAADATGALTATGRTGVTITRVRFLGRATSPLNTAASFPHVAVALSRSTDVRISDCDFVNWRGAGITVRGSTADDYFAYHVKLDGNTFHNCYFGVSVTDRSEYCQLTRNTFSYCRLAIWNSAGNWTIDSNTVVGCYGAYYSFALTSPYGALSSDNWAHGCLVGNTFNHSNGGAKQLWNGNTAFPIGNSTQDPGSGVVVDGVLPPTFTGNALWYTDLTATGLAGTRWLLSGCTFSNLTITCTGTTPVALAGTQSNGAANAPVLRGNVKDLLASLY
ncbi:right-handed parallel beta-helix repeat-containing protein [Streptomyces sp. NBC_01477]|uniref:right-handed parallel beta-helix repeat-containing protein n=1 Tax=Streptomyces sp. NBC_01477 TaxID=2976015 RepID=UPI002E311997|nr:right-handed parallel beta-helix repeat-containing protein [Streptomyces sp. NBC_01477]